MATNTEPAWYQKWLKKNETQPTPILTTNPDQNSITFTCNNGEMLKVADDGFYVRGVKVAVDDKEALAVYNAFNEWLNWSILNR
jgi:hypothetical protein